MHVPLLPVTFIALLVRENVNAATMSLVFNIIALVSATIRPGVATLAVHLVVEPLPIVDTVIKPVIDPL